MDDSIHPLIRRLRRLSKLSPEDEASLLDVIGDPVAVPADRDLKAHGEAPLAVHVIVDGLACRYKILPDGRRQIVAFLVPGDPCDPQVFLLGTMDHGLCTLAPSLVATIAPEEIVRVTAERPAIARAFWLSALVDQSVLREWLVNIGRRDAYERIAHLLWELYLRHRAVGLATGSSFDLPLTQQELADSLGLSAVHVNRTLQRLRADGVLASGGGSLTILQPDELQRISAFDPDYLHLGLVEDSAETARDRKPLAGA